MIPRLLLGLCLLATTAFGQNVFIILEDGGPQMIKEVRGTRLIYEKDGKPHATLADRFGFACATVYRPGLVTISDFRVNTSHLVTSGGDRLNYDLHINGRAKSDTTFKKCFIVLEMMGWKVGGVVFAEVPDLPAGETVELNLNFPLQQQLEEGTYRMHLFSDGIEVLHTKMPEAYLAKQKQKTEALMAGQTQDWPPILAFRTAPAYPEALKKAGVAGSAKISVVVTKNGAVTSPELVSATDAAFGEAALAAVVKWKFDPALKGRKFVDTRMEIPVEFRLPKAKKD